jgi:hypothetical protein
MENQYPKPYAKTEVITISQDTILRPCGVGIDTHKEFIQVCVLKRTQGEIESTEAEFSTALARKPQEPAKNQKTSR